MTTVTDAPFDHQSSALLADLGLLDEATTTAWSKLCSGEVSFAWRHLGTSARTMGEVLTAIESTPGLRPPRTGHLSDWTDIAHGRSSVLDYNLPICRHSRWGRPLLYDFNQTESAARDAGDTLFLPGSLLTGGLRRVLPLKRFDRGSMVDFDRQGPLFLPYVETQYEDERLPLVRLHRRRLSVLDEFDADTHSALLLRRRSEVAEVLEVLLSSAVGDAKRLAQVMDRVVHRDGTVIRADLTHTDDGFSIGPVTFSTAEELIRSAFVPALISQCDGDLGAALAAAPECAPLFSIDVVTLLYAVLGTHLSEPTRGGVATAPHDRDEGRLEPEVHVQWGALAMAGSPPLRKGYFASRVNKARWMYEAVVGRVAWCRPVMFCLAPVSPFFLFPSSTRPNDRPLIEQLISRVLHATTARSGDLGRNTPIVESIARAWWQESGVSGAFAQQLAWTDRCAPDTKVRTPGEPIRPDGFDELSMTQASLLAGALVRTLP